MRNLSKVVLLFQILSYSVFSVPSLTESGKKNYRVIFQNKPKLNYFASNVKNDNGNYVNVAYLLIKDQEPQGTVILVGGRSDYIERFFIQPDLLKTLVIEKNLNVCLYDHRGQGQSDRLLVDHSKGHVYHFKDYREYLEKLIKTLQLKKSAPPFMASAISLGALITIDYIINEKENQSIKAIALVTPFLGAKRFERKDFINAAFTHAASINRRRSNYFRGQDITVAGDKNEEYTETELGGFYQNMALESSVIGRIYCRLDTNDFTCCI